MSAHQLIGSIGPSQVAEGVLEVLAGAPMSQVAGRLNLQPDALSEAVELYKAAGRTALEEQAAGGWYQVSVQWREWESAERTAVAHLGPRLDGLRKADALQSWWFIRKAPCWRIRLRPVATDPTHLKASVSVLLDDLVEAGHIERWRENIYEPEEAAFGGPVGMMTAHHLFSADSQSILRYLSSRASNGCTSPAIGRKELSMLLCSTLMRAAGQEWHEQGDVWLRVARMRPPLTATSERLRPVAGKVVQLMTVRTEPVGAPFGSGGYLSFTMPWFAAFVDAGQQLGTAASDGALHRGVRDVLAHHVLFHWNRLGVSTADQGRLASAAADAVLTPASDTNNLQLNQ
jgi:thiopeptide-type bacteriocin biosynthesis protein